MLGLSYANQCANIHKYACTLTSDHCPDDHACLSYIVLIDLQVFLVHRERQDHQVQPHDVCWKADYINQTLSI